jgi:hypothetical protein
VRSNVHYTAERAVLKLFIGLDTKVLLNICASKSCLGFEFIMLLWSRGAYLPPPQACPTFFESIMCCSFQLFFQEKPSTGSNPLNYYDRKTKPSRTPSCFYVSLDMLLLLLETNNSKDLLECT